MLLSEACFASATYSVPSTASAQRTGGLAPMTLPIEATVVVGGGKVKRRHSNLPCLVAGEKSHVSHHVAPSQSVQHSSMLVAA
jgi:hypothetical protein